jgi:hypothetical protein
VSITQRATHCWAVYSFGHDDSAVDDCTHHDTRADADASAAKSTPRGVIRRENNPCWVLACDECGDTMECPEGDGDMHVREPKEFDAIRTEPSEQITYHADLGIDACEDCATDLRLEQERLQAAGLLPETVAPAPQVDGQMPLLALLS